MPKPGWRLAAGYALFHTHTHSFPLYVEAGHSVVSGTNQIVRSLDIYPMQFFSGYEFMPLSWLSLDVAVGAGVYFAHIDHYDTVLDLIRGNLMTTRGHGFIFSGKLGAGVNLYRKAIELRVNGTIECIWETGGIIPLPGVNLALTVYPGKIVHNILHPLVKNVVEIKEVETVVEKEVETIVEKTVEVEKVIEKEIREEGPFLLSNNFVILFDAEKALLTDEAKMQLDTLAELLKKYPDTKIAVVGSAAPYYSVDSQLELAIIRSWAIVNYLRDTSGIAQERMVVRRPVMADVAAKGDSSEEVQLRSVSIRVYQ